MTDYSKMTPAERELLEGDDALLEDALVPDAGLNVHGAPRGSDTAPASAEAAKADHGGDEDVELRRDPSPAFDVHVPHDANERLAELSQARADVVRLFEDGEITAKEYSDGLERISDQREDIKTRQRWASAATESHERAVTQNWERAVEKFMTTTAKDITAKGEGALLAFDSYVKKVTGDPANAKLSDRAQLAKAHKLFEADFGRLPAGRAQRAEAPTPGSATDHARDAADFAALDRLAETDPFAYQKRIARMSDAEREEYGI